jgi:hypothetical protein
MASPYTLAASDHERIRALLAEGMPERTGLRLDSTSVTSMRSETRLRFNTPVQIEAWTLAASATIPDGRKYAGEIELFRWPEDGWELVHDGLSLL